MDGIAEVRAGEKALEKPTESEALFRLKGMSPVNQGHPFFIDSLAGLPTERGL
jgi:hypothetical protein